MTGVGLQCLSKIAHMRRISDAGNRGIRIYRWKFTDEIEVAHTTQVRTLV